MFDEWTGRRGDQQLPSCPAAPAGGGKNAERRDQERGIKCEKGIKKEGEEEIKGTKK